MLIDVKHQQDDDAAFLFRLRHLISGAIRFARPKIAHVIKVDNWFGVRWLRFAGSKRGEELRPDRLALPPFAPNRVVAEMRYRRTGDRLRRIEPWRLHATKLEVSEIPYYLDELVSSGAFVWYSGNTAAQDRGCLMVYDFRRGADHNAWYAELQKRDDVWTVVNALGTSVEELARLETAYQDRLAPLHPDSDQSERQRLWELAVDAVFSRSYATAAIRIDQFRARYPEDRWIRLLWARSLSQRRLYEEAEREFRAIEHLQSTDRWRSHWLSEWGLFCERRGDLAAAEQAFREDASIHSNHTASWIMLGICLARQGKLDEAEAIHRHATELDGDPDEAFENLGFVLRSQGRLEEAIEAFESARRLCPDADVSEVLEDLRTAVKLRDSVDEDS